MMKVAKLLANFETKVLKEEKMVNGKKEIIETIVPKYKQGKEFSITQMDMSWLMEEEQGGLCVVLGPLDYARITYPDGSKTKYHDLFEYKTQQGSGEKDDA